MKKSFTGILCMLSLGMAAMAQKHMEQVQVEVAPRFKKGALLQLPDDYAQNPKKRYPLIIFLHGRSRSGEDLSKLTYDGIPYLLDKGVSLNTVNPADGKTYKFIIIMPQAEFWGLRPDNITAVMNDIERQYRVDTTRVYLTGYSAGGSGTFTALTDNAALTRRFAAAVPMSPTTLNDENIARLKMIADGNVGIWAFAGKGELRFLMDTRRYVDSVKKYNDSLAIITVHDGGHCCFKQFYDPGYKMNGLNIYEWMLQHKRTVSAAVANKKTHI
ncbi:carboxylesterase family protein [Chitinophaga costaii]|nr:prolyl oligopeptidase family serine peptidase [Chitinophaga costaii]